MVHARGDVGRLLLEINLDQRVVGVEADLLLVVADASNGVANGALDVEVGISRYLADHYAQALGDRRLTRNPRVRFLSQHSIEDGVRDLVTNRVGGTSGHRFRVQ